MSKETSADDEVASSDATVGADVDGSTDGTSARPTGGGLARSTSRRAVLAATTGAVATLGVGAGTAVANSGDEDASITASAGSADGRAASPSSWPMDGFDLRNTRFPRGASAPTGDLEVVWSFDVSVDHVGGGEYKTGRIEYAPPTVADGKALVGDGAIRSERNYLHAIDVETGEHVWRKRMPEMNTAVAVGDGRVFAAGNASRVYGIDLETGTELWQWGTGARVRSSAKYHDGTVYVGCDDGTFYALDPEEGFSQWEYDTTRDAEDLRMYGTQPVHDGLVYLNTWAPDGGPSFVYAIEADAGRTEWRYEVAATGGNGAAPPAVGSERLFVPDGANGRLLAFELGSHDLAWEKPGFEFGPRNGAAVADCRVVVGSEDGHVTAVDVVTGEWAWRSDTRAPVEMPVMIANGTAYAVDERGYLYGFAMQGGGKRFEYRIGELASTTPRTVDDDLLLTSRSTVQRLTGEADSQSVDSACATAEPTTSASTATATETTTAEATTTDDEPNTGASGTDDGSGTTPSGSDGSPGFGVLAGASAVAAAAGVALRRARGDREDET
jgi:outer membrane protein assembly factor BamB